MGVTSSILPGLALLPAGLAVALIPMLRAHPPLREAVSVLAALAQTSIVLLLLPRALEGAAPVWRSLPLAPGAPIELRADPLGTLFALVASTLWVLTTAYSIGYVRARQELHQTRYFACFALCLFATVG